MSETISRSTNKGRNSLAGVLLVILARLGLGLLVLLAIAFLSNLGLRMAAGSGFEHALAPALEQTLSYLSRLPYGDLGQTTSGSISLAAVPVRDIATPAVGRSFGLLALSLCLAAIIGVAIGLWAGLGKRRSISTIVLLFSIVGVSLPSFFAAVLLQQLAVKGQRFFGPGWLPVGGFGWDKHIILPALVLAARPVAQIARVTYVSLRETVEQDYVRTAYSKGLPKLIIIVRHVLRNAAVPILTTIGVSLRYSLSSLPVVELFYGWQGMGYLLLKAISRQDYNLTVTLVLCLGALFILVNLILDLLYRLVDPQLRETPAHISQTVHFGGLIQGLWQGLRQWWCNIRQRQKVKIPAAKPSIAPVTPLSQRRSIRSRLATVKIDWGLLLGSSIVLWLLVIFLFGPYLTPHNPYQILRISFTDGKLSSPPFPPSTEYRLGSDILGRDMLSLLLAGAQRTLLLAALAVIARLVIGFILGTLAGWFAGSWFDRLLLALAEIIAAFPALLLAMIFILAIGIRQGFRPFIIAFCLVGWGEVMQLVRSQVISIRPKLYIESAVAIGLRLPRIIATHILPNLMPALISMAALEMSAVLILLGELGFLGIFIGGGAFAELAVWAPLAHYADVPEWGAILSSTRAYTRSQPWMAAYPALAFFIAILGFNLFGEGIRRLVERRGLNIGRLFNRYTLLLALVLAGGIYWFQNNSGVLAIYRKQANLFSGWQAQIYLDKLNSAEFAGRGLGTKGQDLAADYIAAQFKEYGLQAAGESFSYYQTRQRSFEALTAVPELSINDGGAALQYRVDYIEYANSFRNLGSGQGSVRFVSFGELTPGANNWNYVPYTALQNHNYANEVVVALSTRDAAYLEQVPCAAVLVVADDESRLQERQTLSPNEPKSVYFNQTRRNVPDRPMLWISSSIAERLLAGTGQTLADWRRTSTRLGRDEYAEIATGKQAQAVVTGEVRNKVSVRNVIGHLPGNMDEVDDQLIVVMAQYDTPPSSPDGQVFPGANDNATAVAVMLEAIRILRDSDYEPYRTFLFVAYSGEGLDGGRSARDPEAADFLKAKQGFATAFTLNDVIKLRSGAKNSLQLGSQGNQLLDGLVIRSARLAGIPAHYEREAVDMGIIFEDRKLQSGGQEAPGIYIRLPGSGSQPADAATITKAGRALALTLMSLGR